MPDPARPERRTLLSLGAGALLITRVRPASASTLRAVRVWPARDYTRVTLELERPLEATQLQLSDPPRLVVDLDGLDVDSGLRDLITRIRPDDPYIDRVRIGQYRAHVTRIVFDLKKAVAPQLFALEPAGSYRHRLVIDLYPLTPLDPLQTLLAEVSEQQAADIQRHADANAIADAGSAATADGAGGRTADRPLALPDGDRTGLSGDDPLASWLDRRLRAGTTHDDSAPKVDLAPAAQIADAANHAERPRAATAAKRPSRAPAPIRRLITVAIDAGHGGEDPGAIGRNGTREKDVVLRIARSLRERIARNPEMRAFMTRDGDYFVPLATRVAKAQRVQADLFVSIHADAFVRPEARGASVYILSERGASSVAARWLAQRENDSDRIGGAYLGARNTEARRVLLDLSTKAQIRSSSHLGRIILAELGSIGTLHKASIEQAGFAVLKAPEIPSILVETAFISNPQEERRLMSSQYQKRLADAIYRGLATYLRQHPPPPPARTA